MPRPTRSPYDDNKPWLDQSHQDTSEARGTILSETQTFTNAQIKTWPSTDLVIVPTVEGKTFFFVAAIITTNIVTPYTGVGAAAWAQFQTDGQSLSAYIPNDVSESMTDITDLLTIDGIRQTVPLSGSFNVNWGLVNNQDNAPAAAGPLVFHLDNGGVSDLGGGHVNNFLRVTVLYAIVDI